MLGNKAQVSTAADASVHYTVEKDGKRVLKELTVFEAAAGFFFFVPKQIVGQKI